jgi:hypothetical protein
MILGCIKLDTSHRQDGVLFHECAREGGLLLFVGFICQQTFEKASQAFPWSHIGIETRAGQFPRSFGACSGLRWLE